MADILIGLGGTGGKILKAFRQRLWTEFDRQQRACLPISFIYVDTDNSMLNPNDVSYETIHGNCCFQPNDFVDIKTHSNISLHSLKGTSGCWDCLEMWLRLKLPYVR